MKKRLTRKYGRGVQSVGQPPRAPGGFGADNAADIAVSTAAGFAAGGPVGGAIGLVTSGVKTALQVSAEKQQFAKDLQQYALNAQGVLNDGTLDENEIATQGVQTAEKGIASTGAKNIEVEKDELIFGKTATGKYVLKADYKDGKTHNKGGENYIASRGDVIFPGKDRSKVMKAFNNQDFPKLEAMRVSLPKEADIAEDGFDGTDPKQQYADILEQVKAGKLPQSFADDFLKRNANALQEGNPNLDLSGLEGIDGRLGYNVDTDPGFKMRKQPDGSFARTTTGLTGDQLVEDLNAFKLNYAKDEPLIESPDQRPDLRKQLDPFPATPEIAPAIEGTGGGGTAKPSLPPGTDVQGITDPQQLGTDPDFRNITSVAGKASLLDEMNAKLTSLDPKEGNAFAKGKPDLTNIAGNIAQLGAAAFQTFGNEPEVQDTPDVRLNRLAYEDTSGQLRQQALINEKVAASNARNVAGGNIQNFTANRKQASIDKLRSLQGINSEEFKRRLAISNTNRQIGDKETLINQQQLIGDRDANAANRGASRTATAAGVAKLGEIGGSIARDKTARTQQEQMLNTLNSMGGFEVLADGTIGFKKTTT